jgi:prepilin-type N-terminal cleavage/methylation domain-containing protein
MDFYTLIEVVVAVVIAAIIVWIVVPRWARW